MNMRNWPGVIAGSIVVGALVAAFVLSQSGAGQVPALKTGLAAVALPVNDAAPAVQQAIAPAPVATSSGEVAPSGPGVEGIKVSGHWTIEVRETDGKLVSHTEFENALAVNGQESLARFLARDKTPGLWSINLIGSTGNEPCLSNIPTNCYISEAAESANWPNGFKNLAVSFNSTVARLSGTATAQRNGNVATVQTNVGRCENTTAAASPCQYSGMPFTSKTLPTPVSVLLNQQVAVTVDISFN